MAVESELNERERGRAPVGESDAALAALAAEWDVIAGASALGEVLRAITRTSARATGADISIARVADPPGGELVARAVDALSPAVVAELEGSRLPLAELPERELDDLDASGAGLRGLAASTGMEFVLQFPIAVGGDRVGSLELLRAGTPFPESARAFARLAASQAALALRAFLPADGNGRVEPETLLRLAGEALTAGGDERLTAEQVARVAAESAGADGSLLWRADDGTPVLVASSGRDARTDADRDAAARALADGVPITSEDGRVTLRLGQPPVGALQLFFARDAQPPRAQLERLSTFAVRAAHALRASAHSHDVELELERTRALLEVVRQANAQLSLAHTLETVVARVAELLDVDRVAVYLLEEGRLLPAAGRGLAGPHVRAAQALFELALGPFRGRGMLVLEDAAADPRTASAAEAFSEAGIDAAVAVPLLVHDDVIGLLAVYPTEGRTLTPNESSLLDALAAQLAVAVQNAQLHEQAKNLGVELEQVLDAERAAAKRLRALYEISRSFAQSLSLDTTLDAVARTVVELLDVDAAVIRMPDTRRDLLHPRAIYVGDERIEQPARRLLFRPQPFGSPAARRVFREREPVVLDPETAAQLGPSHAPLVPFLEKGSTAAAIPVATPAEVLASLTLLSLHPERPITDETIEAAVAIGGQAALAIDNARLYQQQKHFSETMQRSLLPQTLPQVEGLDVGAIYTPSAHVELGGDVYDYIVLDDGRLAVVLGDVTGHGIDAAADMAMAKFVFRSLARVHPSPGQFLAAANEVVVGEIAPGKFITMVYLTIDPVRGEVTCASAGHPAPRLVDPSGGVTSLQAGGLALGVDHGQTYEEARAELPVGGAVVVFTDGVVEARNDGDLYGVGRLDALLTRRHELVARDLAAAVIGAARQHAGGELLDDCAVVVIKRTS